MSRERTCPNCLQKENTRYNFGGDHEAEKAFHNERWCNCGYTSPNEMMIDQDFGFNDPIWLQMADEYLDQYYAAINRGLIKSKEGNIRFFLKLLKCVAHNKGLKIELTKNVSQNEPTLIFVEDGEPNHLPKIDLIDAQRHQIKNKSIDINDNSDLDIWDDNSSKDELPI